MANSRLFLLNNLRFFFVVVDLILIMRHLWRENKTKKTHSVAYYPDGDREGSFLQRPAAAPHNGFIHRPRLASLVASRPSLRRATPDSIVRASVCKSHKTLRGGELRRVALPQPQDRLTQRGKSYFSFIYHLPRGRRHCLSRGATIRHNKAPFRE